MKHDTESLLEYAKKRLTLSASEKAFHRAELLELMHAMPARAVPSPFHSFVLHGLRYAFAVVLVIALGGSGVAFAAEGSLPNSPLYIVKVKVTEPIRLALTADQEEKTTLEVALVDRRLKEFARASTQGDLNAGELALVTDSLSQNIDDAQEAIGALKGSEDLDTAFESASDLQSTLAVHAKILIKVQEARPSTSEDVQAVAAAIAHQVSETDALADTAENALGSTTLNEPNETQETDANDSLAAVKADIEAALAGFDASDTENVRIALGEITALIADAKSYDAAGNAKAAYLRYAEADTKIRELQTLLDADKDLGIDVIDTTTLEDQP